MRSAKSNNYESLKELLSSLKSFNKEQQKTEANIKAIVAAAFGMQSQKSLIAPQINFYYTHSPTFWTDQLNSITSFFSPSGEFISGPGGILSSSDYPVCIEAQILPRSVLSQFSVQGDKRSTILRSLKRELGDKYFINNWEWFWCHVAHALVTHPQPQERRTFKQDHEEDQLFFTISRNPYLMIVKQALLHNYRKELNLMKRMRDILEIYIVEELLFATKRRESRAPEIKYQLKSQSLAMVFLLIYSYKGQLQGETLEIYQEYFAKATEYFSAISTQSNSHNIRNIIRIWTYLITNQHSLDSTLVNNLDKANPKDGWYRLARCPLNSWILSTKKTTFSSQQIPTIVSVRKNIYRLLSKPTEWAPCSSLLSILQQFFLFDIQVLQKYLRKQEDKEQNDIIRKCFERILIFLVENGVECSPLKDIQEKINGQFKNTLTKKLDINFEERSEEAKQKVSRSNRELSKSISYQSPRIKNVWQHPIQQNQYYILFQGAYWVSRQLDRLIPGHKKRSQPCLNLRIFSNPLIFLMFFLVLALTLKTLVS